MNTQRYFSVSHLIPVDGRSSFWTIHYWNKARFRMVHTFEQLPREMRRELNKRCIIPTGRTLESGTIALAYRLLEI